MASKMLGMPREVLHLPGRLGDGPSELVRRLLPVLLVLVAGQTAELPANRAVAEGRLESLMVID